MRVAILLSGEARFCKDFDSQISCYNDYDQIDWFVSFWDKTNIDDRRISPSYQAKTDQELQTFLEQKLLSLGDNRHKIADCKILNHEYLEPMPQDYQPYYVVSSQGVWDQFQGIKFVNKLRLAYEQEQGQTYDLVIRSRPDISLSQSISLSEIDKMTANQKIIVMPNNERRGHFQFSDVYAIGSSQTMNDYANAVDKFDNVHTRGIPWNPEWLMGAALYSQSYTWPSTNFNAVIRKHGKWLDNDKGYQDFYPEFGRWS